MLQVAFNRAVTDPLVVRHACIALQHLGISQYPLPLGRSKSIYLSLVSVLTSNALPEKGWYTAAEASLRAISATHPHPISLCTAVLRKIGRATLPTPSVDGAFLCLSSHISYLES